MSLVGSIIAAGGSILSGILGNSAAESNARDQREWQSNENQINRDWQSTESQKARDWEEQMYNLYNSPSAMKKQQAEAGLNPWLSGSDSVRSPMSSSAPMSSAPSAGSGVGAQTVPFPDIGSGIVQALGVESQIGNQQANTDKQKWETASWIYDHFGKDAFDKFADQNDLFGSPSDSQYSQFIASQIFEKNVSTMRNQLEASFLQEWYPKEAQARIDQINKSLDVMTEQIKKYQSDEKLNYANAYKVGSEVAKNFAEAGYFQAMSGQISQILPFLVTQYQLATGMQGMQYLSALANFTSEEKIRDWLNTGFAKTSKLSTYVSRPENNAIFGFVKGVSDSMGWLKPGSFGFKMSGSDSGSESTSATGWYAPMLPR